jgi:hypothetical protein
MAYDAAIRLSSASEYEYVNDTAAQPAAMKDLPFYLLFAHAKRVCDLAIRSEAHEWIRLVRQSTFSCPEDLVDSYVFHSGDEWTTTVIFVDA